MKFKGNIIITDPCYIDDHNDTLWKNLDIFSGDGLSEFGFTIYIWEDTLDGDWSCNTFLLKKPLGFRSPQDLTIDDLQDNPIIGSFCADAGLVGVFLLDEVLAFNPSFDYHISRPWTTTLINDFDGDIEYIIDNNEVFICGTGNVNFITRQSSF